MYAIQWEAEYQTHIYWTHNTFGYTLSREEYVIQRTEYEDM